ncbi:hypothetical protein ABIB94_009069 [Bradyrhizobium sp. JR7.2]|uniref:DUF3024 domain-containing protein n=1 Tax=unclassified Bradyrhizobium TaxID=2631580 RepID=UPI00339813F6
MNAAIIRQHHSGLPAHPNEFDRLRIVRALTSRERYRYVSPKVTPVPGGYLVESLCCSCNIDAEGGLVDVALLHHEMAGAAWQLFRKDHGKGAWEWHSTHQRLGLATAVLNADPERLFWQ